MAARTSALFGLLLLCCVLAPLASAQSLVDLDFEITGVRLAVEPPALAVPKSVATFVVPRLVVPDAAGADAARALEELGRGAAVLAELRGPSLEPTTIAALPGQPLHLPPLHLAGDYVLDGIRLVKDGATVLAGSPSTVPIRVLNEILVSKVTTRELSLDEIRDRGIVIDESSFRVLNFQAAFVIEGVPVPIDYPVILPRRALRATPGQTAEPLAIALDQAFTQQQQLQQVAVELPPELDIPGLHLFLAGAEFVAVAPDLDAEELPGLAIPPIPALIVIPGNIGFLNQFFSAIVLVENGAPAGTGLVVRDVTARLVLPRGKDQVAGTHDVPGDDPLRVARTASGVIDTVPVRQRGADGEIGTTDDLAALPPGAQGEGELLIEGLREGTHVFDLALGATLEGLPSGPVALEGLAKGTVVVRNATFSLSLSHPKTVRAGEPYDLFATVTNTSDRTANLVSVTLDRRAVSGAELLSEETVTFATLASGEAATARFRLRAARTGEVTYSQITSDPGVVVDFSLRTGIDERGVELSPAALVLPAQTSRLPDDLVFASQRVLGLAFSVATAPRLPQGVRFVPQRTVVQRGRELADAGVRFDFAEPRVRPYADLALDWLGGALGDEGFDSIARGTEAGAAWQREMGRALAAEIGAATSSQLASVLELQQRFAEATVGRIAPHVSAVVGDGAAAGPARVRVLDGAGRSTGGPRAEADRAERATLPFAGRLPLDEPGGPDGPLASELALVARIDAPRYVVEARGTGSGTTDLGVVVPRGDGDLVQVVYEGLATAAGSRFVVAVDLAAIALGQLPSVQVDANGDGAFEQTLPATRVVPILDQGPRVVAARMLTDVSESFVYNSKYAHMGLLVDVLFSKPVTESSVEDTSRYAIPRNAVRGAVLQATGRVATLALAQPIGSVARDDQGRVVDLTVEGVADAEGAVSPRETVAIAGLLADGARVIGQALRADGRPVPGAIIDLSAVVAISFPGGITLARVEADANGYFDFDFVRRTDSPLFTVAAFEPRTGEQATVRSRVRFDGGTQAVNPVFVGRGRVVGTVLRPDGATPAGICAVNLFPGGIRSGNVEARGVFADGEGRFAIEDVPVGPFTLAVDRVELRPDAEGVLQPVTVGEFASASDSVPSSGGEVVVEVVLVTNPEPGFGDVRGRAFFGDGSPAARVRVFVGDFGRDAQGDDAIVARAATEADDTGSFDFRDLPPGGHTIIALDPATGEVATAGVSVVASAVAGVNVRFGVLEGSVTGIVRDAAGQLVPNALVAGGFALVSADANGRFTIPAVPAGSGRGIAAGNPLTKRTGRADVDVFPGEVTEVEIVLEARADLRGRVLDATGQPVAGAEVRIPFPPVGYSRAETDASGNYVFPNMSPGTYLVSAQGRNQARLPNPDEVAAELNDDIESAVASGSEAAIRAAFQAALEVFVTDRSQLFLEAPPATPGLFGFVRGVRVVQDGVTAFAPDIVYIPTGRVAGRTVDGNGLGTKARMDCRALRLDRFGQPMVESLGFFDSDAVTGAFRRDGITHGTFFLAAARPFSPRIEQLTGELSALVPDRDDIVIAFPPAGETSGTFSGVVFAPDGVAPAGEGVEVAISFGGLTVTTAADGTFASPTPILAGVYTVTATDPTTTLAARTTIRIRAGEDSHVPLRLRGRGAAVVSVVRPDGTAVPGAAVTVRGGDVPGAAAAGTTDATGSVRFTNLPEGGYGAGATEGDNLAGMAGFEVAQADVLAGRDAGVVVTLRAFGTIEGRLFEVDRLTPVPNGQVALFIAGIAEFGRSQGAAVTTTDADGLFRFERVPAGSFRIEAKDPRTGRVARTNGRLRAQGEVVEVVLVPDALGRVEGVVLSADGLTPVAGAAVSVQGILSVTASADGSFDVGAVPQGTFEVDARDRVTGFGGSARGEIRFEGEVAFVEVRLAAFGTVRGRVFERDAGGALVPVTAAQVRLSTRTLGNAILGRSTAVDATGAFELQRVPAGTQSLSAVDLRPGREQNGGEAQPIALLEQGQVVDVEIVLEGIGDVAVTVTEADGTTPVPSARVALTSHSGFGGTRVAFTDALGQVAFAGMALGRLDARASSTQLRVAGAASGELASQTEPLALPVKLAAAGTIRGRLVLPDLQTPVPGAFVTLDFDAQVGAGTVQETTDATGAFVFESIPASAEHPFRIEVFETLSEGRLLLEGSLVANEEVIDLGTLVLDLEAPGIVSTVPIEGATDAPPGQVIEVVFSEPIDPASVDLDEGGQLGSIDGNVVVIEEATPRRKLPGRAEVSADGTTLRIIPDAPLLSEARYEVSVRGGPAAIRDLAAGRPVARSFLLTFTARDSVPPVLVSASPADGLAGVPAEAVVRLAFSEAVSENLALTLARGGLPVAGRVDLLFGGTVVAFTPAAPLVLDEVHAWTLAGAADLAGNGLVDAQGAPLPIVTASFETLDTRGPTIAALDLAGAPSRLGGTVVTLVPAILDADAVAVEYAIDDVPTARLASAPFAFTTTLPIGRPSIRVTATAIDEAQNRGTPLTTEVVIEANAPPAIVLVRADAAGTSADQGTTVRFEATATDDAGLARVFFAAVGAVSAGTEVVVSGASATRTFDVAVPANATPGAPLTVQAVARDLAGEESAPATITLTVADAAPPVVAIQSPVAGAQVIPGQNFAVVVRATDPSGVVEVALATTPALVGSGVVAISGAPGEVTQTFTLAVPASLVAPQAIALSATATDAVGRASAIATRTVHVVDTVAPEVTALRVLGGQTQVSPGGSFTVEVEASDAVGVTRIDLALSGLVTSTVNLPVSPAAAQAVRTHVVQVSAAAGAGAIDVAATARDAAGNVAATLSIRVDVGDGDPPQIAIPSPASGTLVHVGATLPIEVAATDTGLVRKLSLTTTGAFATTVDEAIDPPAVSTQRALGLVVPNQAGLAGQAVTVTARAEDASGNVATADVDLTVVTAFVEGVVRDDQGQPIAGASVRVEAPNGTFTTTTSVSAPVGFYRVTGVTGGASGGNVLVTATDPVLGLRAQATQALAITDAGLTVDVAINLSVQVVEPGWALVRSVVADDAQAAHLNPVDGFIYFGRRVQGGLQRIAPDGTVSALLTAEPARVAGVVCDPVSGAVFASDSFAERVVRFVPSAGTSETWLSGFSTLNDDPIGMAIAPAGYAGPSFLSAGQGLVADPGNSGAPTALFVWSPAALQFKSRLGGSFGFIDFFEVAIARDAVYALDGISRRVLRLGDGAAVEALVTSPALAFPTGLAVDPRTGQLIVLDTTAKRVVRLDPENGRVTDLAVGFPLLAPDSFAGVDVSADGLTLVVTDNAADKVHVFELLLPATEVVGRVTDAAGNPAPGAAVAITDRSFRTFRVTADASGDYRIAGLLDGTLDVVVVGAPGTRAVVQASLGVGVATLVLDIQLDILPTVTSPPAAAVTAGQPLTFQLAAGGTPPPVIAVGALPGWLVFDPDTAVLSGTPTDADVRTSVVQVTATNRAGQGTQALLVRVGADLAAGPLVEQFGTVRPASWSSNGDWQFGTPRTGGSGDATFPPAAFDGPCAGTILQGDYVSTDAVSVLETPLLDLDGVVDPVLRFHHFFHLEQGGLPGQPGGTLFDGANLKVSTDGGATFQVLSDAFFVAPTPPYTGTIADSPLAGQEGWGGLISPADWQEVVVDLDAALGAQRDRVVFRFELGADVTIGRPGWYVDNVRVGAAADMPVPPAISVASTAVATTGQPLALGFGVTGSPAPSVQVTSVPPLPASLVVDVGAGTIAGVPLGTDAGFFAIQITATNVAAPSTATARVDLTIAAGTPGLALAGNPLVEGFDGGALPVAWAADNDWEIGVPPPRSGFGTTRVPGPIDGACAATRLAVNYSRQKRSRLQTPALDLRGVTAPRLRFRHFFQTEGPDADGGHLAISVDGGATFQVIPDTAFVAPTRPYTTGALSGAFQNPLAGLPAWSGLIGSQAWERAEVDLDLALGAAARDRVVIRFDFGTDSKTERAGWFIDDVHVGAAAELPTRLRQEPTVAVTEVLNAPGPGTAPWVELLNFGPHAVDLDGFTLADEDGDLVTMPALALAPGGFAIVTTDKAGFEAQWLAGTVDARVLQVGATGFGLDPGADEVILADSFGVEAWRLAYADDDEAGRATHLASANDFRTRSFGTKAAPGVVRAGSDNAPGTPFLGYEGAASGQADPFARAAANGDLGSPLEGNFAVELAADPHEPDQGADQPTSIAAAAARPPLLPGITVHGTVTDGADFYLIPPGAGTVVDLVFTQSQGDLDLFVFDPLVPFPLLSTSSSASVEALVLPASAATGFAFAVVVPKSGTTPSGQIYRLRLDAVPLQSPATGPDAHEDDDDIAQASARGAFPPDATFAGTIFGTSSVSPGPDGDLFRIEVPAGFERIEIVQAQIAPRDTVLILRNAAGQGILSSGSSDHRLLTFTAPAGGGTFFIDVFAPASLTGSRSYWLRYTLRKP